MFARFFFGSPIYLFKFPSEPRSYPGRTIYECTVFASCIMHKVMQCMWVWVLCETSASHAQCVRLESLVNRQRHSFLFMTGKTKKQKNDWKQMGILKILWLVPRASLSPSQVCMHRVWLHFICTIIYLSAYNSTNHKNFLSLHQEYPLHVAAKHGNLAEVKHLVDEGARINIKDNNEVST